MGTGRGVLPGPPAPESPASSTPDPRAYTAPETPRAGPLADLLLKETVAALHEELERRTAELTRIRKATQLPIAVGFGVKTPAHAAEIARIADAVVVGSAIVSHIAEKAGQPALAASVVELCRSLAASTHGSEKSDKVRA